MLFRLAFEQKEFRNKKQNVIMKKWQKLPLFNKRLAPNKCQVCKALNQENLVNQ